MTKLGEYLKDNRISLDAFASAIGVANASVVHRYVTGKRVPRPRMMQAIIRETNGAVTANDFFPPPPSAQQTVRAKAA